MPGLNSGVTFGGGSGGAALSVTSRRFLKGTAANALLASIIAPAGWTVTLLSDFGGRVKLSGRQVQAASVLSAVASGTAKMRAVSADGRDAVERTFDLSVYEEGVTPPVPAAGRPLIFATGGDSLDQRGMDILGAPNSLTSGVVDPQNLRWPTELTSSRGGTQRGFTSALQDESAGKVMFLQTQHFNGIGGFNSGQWRRNKANDPTPRYLTEFMARIDAAIAAGWPLDGILFNLGVNDVTEGAIVFNTSATFSNLTEICQVLIEKYGKPIILANIPPRGNTATPGTRAFDPNVPLATNAKLAAEFEGQAVLQGKVFLVDIHTALRDTTTADRGVNDIRAEFEHDGLHWSQDGKRVVAREFLKVINNRMFPGTFDRGMPTANGAAGSIIPNAIMSGTTGTSSAVGNATSNADFTLNGKNSTAAFAPGNIPDGWSVATRTGWSGTTLGNIKGAITTSQPKGSGVRVVGNLDGRKVTSGGAADTNSQALAVEIPLDLAKLNALADGDFFEGLAEVDLTAHAGVRGASVELILAEPDGVTRTIRSAGDRDAYGTNRKDIAPATDMTKLLLQTGPVQKKAGSYTAATLAVLLYVPGAATSSFTLDVSRADARRVTWKN